MVLAPSVTFTVAYPVLSEKTHEYFTGIRVWVFSVLQHQKDKKHFLSSINGSYYIIINFCTISRPPHPASIFTHQRKKRQIFHSYHLTQKAYTQSMRGLAGANSLLRARPTPQPLPFSQSLTLPPRKKHFSEHSFCLSGKENVPMFFQKRLKM